MAKQIKVGFDKVPTPNAEQEELLYDLISATPLTNNARQRLTTTEVQPVAAFGAAKNSASTVINNQNITGQGGSLPVAEAFPEFSEVSSTLLGVARAEEQLSLFSDVSSYGLDSENWEITLDSDGIPESPKEWSNREHPLYGARNVGGMFEQTREQALELSTFPVPYSYPYGPEFELSGQYAPELYSQYINFIAVGKILYEHYYTNGYEEFADRNFIKSHIKIENVAEEEVTGYFVSSEGEIIGLGEAHRINYSESLTPIQETFNQIENFTIAWQGIVNENIQWPDATFQSSEETADLITNIRAAQASIRPGYYTNTAPAVKLQSKKVFRYQPGRISGFTFGTRNRVDPGSSAAKVEWGITNDTDEYMFQVQGANFSIIRRSTVPLSDDLLERMELQTTDQIETRKSLARAGSVPFYETRISRDRFNKDALLGNGPSGYVISFEQVTMYKVEFGWYGAIGAKFYAYIPVGNEECRWVLLHHLVIENGIDKPCLEDPNFRFTYRLDVENTATVSEPIYIYKYGSSCFIDGGDEGTLQVYSARSERKGFTDNSPVLGLLPKDSILNRDGVPKTNNKKVYPDSISVTSSQPAQIKIISVPTSPEGMHTHYSPSLVAGVSNRSREVDLAIGPDGSTITVVSSGDTLTSADYDAHIIADGVYNGYINPTSQTGANVMRRDSYEPEERAFSQFTSTSSDGRVRQWDRTITNARLSNLNTVVASTFPITSNVFKVHFLNKSLLDPAFNQQVANFAIGFTQQEPKLVPTGTILAESYETGDDAPSALLRFGQGNEILNVRDMPHAIYANAIEGVDPFSGEDFVELNFVRDRFLLDPEIENISDTSDGENDGGKISAMLVEIRLETYQYDEIESIGANQYRIKFFTKERSPDISQNEVDSYSIELGSGNDPSGITVISPRTEVQVGVDEGGDPIYNYYLDLNISNAVDGAFDDIVSTRIFQLKSIHILENALVNTRNDEGNIVTESRDLVPAIRAGFNVLPLYPVFALGDYARINNIVIEEYTPTGKKTHTPQFISSSISYDTQGDVVTTIQNTGGSSAQFRPANFQSLSLASSILSDEDIEQPLRNSELIYSSYIDGGKTSTVNLNKIFGFDRKVIQPNRLKNQAYFFTLSRIKSGTPEAPEYTIAGEAEVALTLREQL